MSRFSELTSKDGKFHTEIIYSEEKLDKPERLVITVNKSEDKAATVYELAEAIYNCFRADSDSFDIKGQGRTIYCEVNCGEHTYNLELNTNRKNVDELLSYMAAQMPI